MSKPAEPTPPRRPAVPRAFIFIVAIALGVAAIWIVSQYLQPRERVAWQSSLPAAQATAEHEHRPLLVYFTASWCGPCQQMKQTTFTDAAVARALAPYVLVKLDIDANENAQPFAKWARGAVPAFIILDEHGTAVRGTDGFMDAEMFVRFIKNEH